MPKVKIKVTETVYHEKEIDMSDNEFVNLILAESSGTIDEFIGDYMGAGTDADGEYEDGEYEIIK